MNFQTPSFTYNNNQQYRQALRSFFNMECTGSDDESEDELLFDNTHILSTLDRLYEDTYRYPLFSDIYELAAACFISTDKKIGLTILFSYDYFSDFYLLLYDLNRNGPESIDFKHVYYMKLRKLLTR
jgi:hypothetical protein